jgi:hypothetical protein
VHAGDATKRINGQNKVRRNDNRKGQGNGPPEVRKEVAGGSSKVADVGVDSGGQSRFSCNARLEGQPRKMETAPSKPVQREGRSTSTGHRQEREEKRKVERDGANGTTDEASMYEKWGAYNEARSRVEVEKGKVTEQKEAASGGASFSSRGPADVGGKANNLKRRDGASPQESREGNLQSGDSDRKHAEVEFDERGGDSKQGGSEERTGFIIRGPPQCLEPSCKGKAVFGYRQGSKALIPRWCRKHSKPDMLRKCHSICEVDKCFTCADFAFCGQKRRSRCGQHREEGMIMLGHTCDVEGCEKIASYRRVRGQKSTQCSTHRDDNMINRHCCKSEGCKIYASFGYAGTGCWIYCKKHREME